MAFMRPIQQKLWVWQAAGRNRVARPGMLGQLTLVSNDLFTTTGYTALGNNNKTTVF